MIDKIDLKNDNVIGFKVKGKVDDLSFKESALEILDALEDDSHFNIYLEIESLSGVEFQVLFDSLKLGLSHLGDYLKKVDKIAVVTNIGWFERATKIENKLISSIEEKVFKPGEREMAKAWVST
ncbi:SpoIIAA family protein [Fulvivirga lutea]|uniref:STAS/SEC14 domain-containing protein n=1 Tax=Fulvivirga lutea TaxID=2810512 RepID=A0A974WDM5_9BACT|nr:STAS/SEC14 domain-containing protein [Fulvivirga lutea]QSE95896.1 STAS/SEC14 domain-containing protein [Fulvivirga lutea]